MDSIEMLLSWQFIVFGLAIAAVIFVIRTGVDFCVKNFKLSQFKINLWHDLLLPVFPVFIGAVAAYLMKTFPYPEQLNSSGAGGRVLFGVVAGLFSGLIYRVVKSLISQKIKSSKNSN